jgi:predicted nucleic acid-binding protein
MPVIVDASVVLKLVMEEDDSDVARALFASEVPVAPDLLLAECANSLWVKARRSVISRALAEAGIQLIEAAPIRLIGARPHIRAAQLIAFELDRSAYDSLYLATAIAERIEFVTADMTFARAAMAHPTYAGSIRPLIP